jgi:hypothetical protein
MNKLLILLAAAALAFPSWAEGANSAEPVWSSAFERFLAPHWVAGEGAGAADAGRRFLIACDPRQGSYLRSLRELAELRAEYRKNPDPQAWAQGRYWNYTCISRNSLRLAGPTNLPLPKPANPDEDGINEGYYRIVREDAESQLIELHYRNRHTDIYDSFYKYEVRGDQVIPLESWVWGRGNFQVFFAEVLATILLLVVMAVVYKLVRFLVRRKAGAGLRGSDQ